jgi:endogenous inhibitor of DNA gyrase (YacG/DUF329 family)
MAAPAVEGWQPWWYNDDDAVEGGGATRRPRAPCPICSRGVANEIASLHQHFTSSGGHRFEDVRSTRVRAALQAWDAKCDSAAAAGGQQQHCPSCHRRLAGGADALWQHAYSKPACRRAVRASLLDDADAVRSFDEYMSWGDDDDDPRLAASPPREKASDDDDDAPRRGSGRRRRGPSASPAPNKRRRGIISLDCPLCGEEGLLLEDAERHFRRRHACDGRGAAWMLATTLAAKKQRC